MTSSKAAWPVSPVLSVRSVLNTPRFASQKPTRFTSLAAGSEAVNVTLAVLRAVEVMRTTSLKSSV